MITPAHRVIRLAGDDGNLTKESFIKILKSSDFFMKAFDKNKDGGLTLTKFTSLMTKLNKGQNNELSEKVNKKRMLSRHFTKIAKLEEGLQSWIMTEQQFEHWLRPAK